MSSRSIQLSENSIKALSYIQQNYSDVIDLFYQLESYIMKIENETVPAEDTLQAMRNVRKLNEIVSPLEF
ncbi:hypothetical protein JGH11_04620 [Dysgonomonas sp. Marseille-P4677]|uniref:hypothetical protein n=1 Tax=Dysgonomonas sp. Marseille-P4677 TaxID=2364790 RepID=UPI001913BBB2|nr:hypothetical protein [Dysgonomonas sp. Marseille-P4677]MBK5720151.1 hypothetical protein [Dysgonomonas sp. Marseille-P4677]